MKMILTMLDVNNKRLLQYSWSEHTCRNVVFYWSFNEKNGIMWEQAGRESRETSAVMDGLETPLTGVSRIHKEKFTIWPTRYSQVAKYESIQFADLACTRASFTKFSGVELD